jgi:hypothetical protein
VRQQILARGRYGAGGSVREHGAVPQASAAPSLRQNLQPPPLPPPQQQQQRELVHEIAVQTLKQLRESNDPAVAPFAAAAAELFSSNNMADEGQEQAAFKQRDLGLLGNMLMDQLRVSAAKAEAHG